MDKPQTPAPASPPTFIDNIDFCVVDTVNGVKVGITLTWKDDKRTESLLLDIETADQFCLILANRVQEARRRIGVATN